MKRFYAALGVAATIAGLGTALFAAEAGSASAGAGTTVTGTVQITNVETLSARPAGGNLILEVRYQGFKSGLWDWQVTGTMVIHPNGTADSHAHGTFSGPAGDCGDVNGTFEITGKWTVNPDGSLAGGTFHAHSIDESTNPGGFRFNEVASIDGSTGNGPYTITYACR